MYAIIEDSGTQVRVAEGDILDLDLRELEEGTEALTFDRVLVVGEAGGDDSATIGQPYVKGAKVTAAILGEVQGDKLTVFKYKRRKGYRRKRGHRQRHLRVKITGVSAG